jgi:DNA-binding response OmpR family regulator
VVVVADGAEALFQLSYDRFDLVLADVWMPLVDGLKLLEVVREKRVNTPVVLMTGRGDPGLEASCLAMGAADYLTKPFDGRTLLARLGNVLRRAQETHAS